ncbi:MAG TPA: hypothetical protein VHT73_01080 [Thermodesulfobacteriota bacterium]|nr:hypothetical protein [Thermodesulfobacteriota bacterium]
MTVTIAPFEINHNCPPLLVGHEKRNGIKSHSTPITYWGVYLNEKFVSYTSSRELAEKTKLWIEKWLRDRI